jgi:predicted transposase/invertase (TIGR01784 family)
MTLEMLKKDTYDSGFTAGEEYGRKEGISIGLSQGAREAKLETAKSMKIENMPISMISHFTGLSPEEIEKM